MDIGTAKPSPELRSRLPHILIDIKDPDEQYTAGEFARLAREACDSAHSRGLIPIVSGGTGFYIRNLLCGPSGAPPESADMRLEVAADLRRLGADALRAELEAADPASARRIHPNDLYRLTRAVEILRSTGRPPSDFAPPSSPRGDMDFLVVGVERPKAELAERIRSRVKSMMEAGLPEELRRLKAAGFSPSSPGMQAIGYKEFFQDEGKSIESIAEDIVLHSIQYAKRQMTFLRALPGIIWIGPDKEALLGLCESFFLQREQAPT